MSNKRNQHSNCAQQNNVNNVNNTAQNTQEKQHKGNQQGKKQAAQNCGQGNATDCQ